MLVTSYPTQGIVNHEVQALVRQELDRQRAEEAVRESRRIARLRRQVKSLETQAELRQGRDARYYREKIAEARRNYPAPQRGSRAMETVADILWGLYGLVILGLCAINDAVGVTPR